MQQADHTASYRLCDTEPLQDPASGLNAPWPDKQQRAAVATEVSHSDIDPADGQVKDEALAWLTRRLSWERQLDDLQTARAVELEQAAVITGE